jgi:hypothetical protein
MPRMAAATHEPLHAGLSSALRARLFAEQRLRRPLADMRRQGEYLSMPDRSAQLRLRYHRGHRMQAGGDSQRSLHP